jgi:hypothetical protein
VLDRRLGKVSADDVTVLVTEKDKERRRAIHAFEV